MAVPLRAAGAPATDSGESRRSRPALARLVRVAVISLVALIALAVAIQAQRVAGQQALDEIRSESNAESRRQADLRAELAEAESPSVILAQAEGLGLVEPGAVVAVPAAEVVSAADAVAVPGARGRG